MMVRLRTKTYVQSRMVIGTDLWQQTFIEDDSKTIRVVILCQLLEYGNKHLDIGP